MLAPRRDQDHPRRCGENLLNVSHCACLKGSPPQVRGKPHMQTVSPISSRITPAGAGKTPHNTPRRFSEWDHPRRCGENRYSCSRRRSRRGSPPQVRGKLSLKISRIMPTGITPAGAGKTQSHIRGFRRRQDHPRRCGENPCSTARFISSTGSPPQVRGKQTAKSAKLLHSGITPAGAGKTATYERINNDY